MKQSPVSKPTLVKKNSFQNIKLLKVKRNKLLKTFIVEDGKREEGAFSNVKEVVFTEDVRDFTSYTFKPQLRTVGPKYGKQLGGIQKTLSSLDGNVAMDDLNANGALKFMVGDVEVELTKDDLLIEMAQKEGYVSEENNKMTVVLDTNLTDELIEEGYVFEVISKIQTMRKDSGFEVMDHINVYVSNNDKICNIVDKNSDFIKDEVLADNISIGENCDNSKEWNINGEKVMIGVKKN